MQPFTWVGGLIVAASAVALFHYGLGRIDLILLGVGAVGLGVGALSLLLTVLAAVLCRRAARKLENSTVEHRSLECGYWAATGFSIPSFWYLPFVSVRWSWEEPLALVRVKRKRGRAHEEVFGQRRGETKQIVRRFDVGDIFGLCKITFRSTQSSEIRMMSWVGALRQMHVLRGLASGDDISHPEGPPQGDRYDMRHYVPGDPIRFILWKVFAKTRQLVIRTPERAISQARQTAVYMVADSSDEPAAGAARMAVDFGAFGGDWVLGADGSEGVATSREKALDLLVRSAGVSEARAGGGLSSFLNTAAAGSMARAVVFVPPRPGPWLGRVQKAVAGVGGTRIQFIVGIDGLDGVVGLGKPQSRWMREHHPGLEHGAQRNTLFAAASASELGEVLRGLGHNVLVVDRMRGHIFTAAQLQMAHPRTG